jgi:hypothetical protein
MIKTNSIHQVHKSVVFSYYNFNLCFSCNVLGFYLYS